MLINSMGCASSAYLTNANREILSKHHRSITTNAIPTNASPLKDMPDVVEKVIDVINDSDAEVVTIFTSDLKFKNSPTANLVKDTSSETNVGSSPKGYGQGFVDDNNSATLCKAVHEEIEDITYLSGFRDFDSLDTSSPESEIEEALANNSLNPPTPKPTLTELEDLYVIPINNDYQEINTSSKDKKKIQPTNKLAHTPIVLNEPTDWEKQADMLASTRKYNPVEAMRKLKRESTRAASSLPQRDVKSRNQYCVEENINDYSSQTCTQSSDNISSTTIGRADLLSTYSIDADTFHGKPTSDKLHEDHLSSKQNYNEKLPQRQNESHNIAVKKNKLPSSPSNFKIRERCAVCYNKYKT